MRERTLGAPQQISLTRARAITEAVKEHPDQPRAIQLASGLAQTFGQLPVRIAEGERIVGELTEKFNGAILYTEMKSDFLRHELDDFGERQRDRYLISEQQKKELRDHILSFWDGNSAFDHMLSRQRGEVNRYMNDVVIILNNDFSGANHLGHINYSRVLEQGFQGIVEEARTAQERLPQDDPEMKEKRTFYRSVILAAEAVMGFAERYSERASKLAEQATSEARKQELEEIARITGRVPREPAQTFREAVQSFWFAFLGLMNLDGAQELSLGRLDQILYPYYQRDLDQGRLSNADAQELISELFIKLNRMPHLKESAVTLSHDGGFPRTVTLGGVDTKGRDAVNFMSLIILEAVDTLRLTHPNIAVRLHPNTPETFKKRVFQIMTNGSNVLHVFNDDVIINGLTEMGLPSEAARDYIISGCVQPIASSTYGPTCSAYINGPKILELILNQHKPVEPVSGETDEFSPPQFSSYEEFWEAFKAQSKDILEAVTEGMTAVHEIQHRLLPNPILSALTDGTVKSGRDVKAVGARYNVTGLSLVGLGTLVDSLAATRHVVFESKTHSLAEVTRWLKANFEGYEVHQQMLRRRTTKYGNDHPQTDRIAKEIVEWFVEVLSKKRTYKGGHYTLGLHAENLHVPLGQLTGATPDGRQLGEPFSPGCGPTSGMDQGGPTASLRSLATVDYTKVMGGASVNMRFNPSLLKKAIQVDRFGSMVQAFFQLGGPHLQVNAVDAKTLRDAQESPEEHRNLIVRITGYSAHFIELARETQEEIIQRTQMDL
jgi:pyruvate formate-lyase/glycerol dehydratase family glycyl radical enzyme